MSIKQLQTAITDSGIISTHFFNGQLLSGEDLTRDQTANREARQLLGRALGTGIVNGLRVKHEPTIEASTKTVVSIQPGIAINAEGRIVEIKQKLFLNLEADTTISNVPTEEFFVPCPDYVAEGATYVAGAGLYLLTMMPVEVKRGRAVVNGLRNASANCARKTVVDGVQFRLIALDYDASELADMNKVRNHFAYKMFGTNIPKYDDFFANPFGNVSHDYGMLSQLHGTRLFDCDIPLALVFWTAEDGLRFVDNWSVRRRTTRNALTQSPLFAPDKRLNEIEAMMLQFQDHMADLRLKLSVTEWDVIQMRQHFRYIPPAGVIPLRTNRIGEETTLLRGVNFLNFFDGVNYRALIENQNIVIDGARVTPLMRAARHYPPIDLNSEELIWIYSVRQNLDSIDTNPTNPPQQYVIYTTGHMPFVGDARYDINRYDYSNYFLLD